MIKDLRSKTEMRLDAVKRLFLWYVLSKPLKLVLVSEYPKSGGTWVTQMLSEYFELPFRRNRNVKLEKAILHGHHLYNKKFYNAFYVVRDGRDIMVSYYFHLLFNNDRNSPDIVAKNRSKVPFNNYNDIEKNMPLFIEYMFNVYERRFFHFTWSEFVNSLPFDSKTAIIKYENLLINPIEELNQAIKFVYQGKIDKMKLSKIVEKYSFQNLSKRKPGEQNNNSFLRKGISGDWKNHFSKKAKEVFNYYGGKELIKFGYEKDESWINIDV